VVLLSRLHGHTPSRRWKATTNGSEWRAAAGARRCTPGSRIEAIKLAN